MGPGGDLYYSVIGELDSIAREVADRLAALFPARQFPRIFYSS